MTTDLSRSPLPIPPQFRDVPYNAEHFPGAGTSGLEDGANCQQYAYSVLRYFGFVIPDFRSSELWEDTLHTRVSPAMQPFDLVLLNREPRAYGAHVGLCVGDGLILHLSRGIGMPALETLAEMQARPEYSHLIGCKSILVRGGQKSAVSPLISQSP